MCLEELTPKGSSKEWGMTEDVGVSGEEPGFRADNKCDDRGGERAGAIRQYDGSEFLEGRRLTSQAVDSDPVAVAGSGDDAQPPSHAVTDTSRSSGLERSVSGFGWLSQLGVSHSRSDSGEGRTSQSTTGRRLRGNGLCSYNEVEQQSERMMPVCRSVVSAWARFDRLHRLI